MPRRKQYRLNDVLDTAMRCFWRHGYYALSIRDLVAATGVNRHGLYSEFGDKHGLFLAAARHYISVVVTPAFTRVEQPGARLGAVSDYLAQQLDMAVRTGLPGVGCLLGNAMVECAPHDAAIRTVVASHVSRLEAGYRNVIHNQARAAGTAPDVDALAAFAATATQGLWGMCRLARHASPLGATARLLVGSLEAAVEAGRE